MSNGQDRCELIAHHAKALMSLLPHMSYNESYLGEPNGLLRALVSDLHHKMHLDFKSVEGTRSALALVGASLLRDLVAEQTIKMDANGAPSSKAGDLIMGILSHTVHEPLVNPRPQKLCEAHHDNETVVSATQTQEDTTSVPKPEPEPEPEPNAESASLKSSSSSSPGSGSAIPAGYIDPLSMVTDPVTDQELADRLTTADQLYYNAFIGPYNEGINSSLDDPNPYAPKSQEHTAFEYGRQTQKRAELVKGLQAPT